MLFTIIIFLLILSLLIFVHELGHFMMARRVGAKVEEFGFGFPPRIFGIRRGETIYSLNLIPIGGFVKILGEDGEDRDNPRSINSKSIWQRTQVFSAGVIMNFILAVALLSVGYAIGLPAIVDGNQNDSLKNPKIQITEVVTDSPAAEAGIKVGDEIMKVENSAFSGSAEGGQNTKVESIVNVEDVQNFVSEHKGEEIILTIKRGQEEINLSVVPRENFPDNEGSMGIGLAKTAIVSYPIHEAIYQGVKATINLTILIIVLFAKLIWGIITTGHLIFEIGGPVAIVSLTGDAAKMGLIYLLQFTALISINLAVINALPFPALDGGHLFFLAVEKIRKRPVSKKILNTVNNLGFTFLLLLMLVITVHDVMRLDLVDKIKGIF
jgi:regulator of sigma E protease